MGIGGGIATPVTWDNAGMGGGIIPVEWKSSTISPINKKGSKNDVASYRPICLTSVACKILERILKANILQHLKKLLE